AMDGLCGASLRRHRTIVALDSKQGKALSLVTFFVALDKESDPAACGRKHLIFAGRQAHLTGLGGVCRRWAVAEAAYVGQEGEAESLVNHGATGARPAPAKATRTHPD
ncbi:hypothetical protein CHR60_14965, partial [Faecalibacterium prausnitzii]